MPLIPHKGNVKIVGKVNRLHSYFGQLRLVFYDNVSFDDYLFIYIQKKPVPFKIVELKGSRDNLIVSLEGIQTEKEAQKLVGLEFGTKVSDVEIDNQENVFFGIEGFLLFDTEGQSLGKVLEHKVGEFQDLLTVKSEENEFLIPLVDDFIVEINEAKKIIVMQLPEGLLELNK